MTSDTIKRFRIGSEWHDGAGEAIRSVYAGDGSVAGVVARATARDVDEAVAVAEQAYRKLPWRKLRPDVRATTLYEIGRRITAEREPLAHLQMLDSGKPLKECQHMVDNAAYFFRYYAARLRDAGKTK